MAVTKTLFSILACVAGFLSVAVRAEYVVHERRDEPLREDVVRNRIKPDTVLPIRIALHANQNARSNAEDWVMAVSDPDSPNFGQFWGQDRVIEAFKPTGESVDAVRSWLSSNGVEEAAITHSDNKQWLAFDLQARHAEVLLKTRYFESMTAKGAVEVSCDEYKLPSEMQQHVDFVKPGVKSSAVSESTRRRRRGKRDVNAQLSSTSGLPLVKLPPSFPKHPPKNPDSLKNCDREASPACVRALYHFEIPDPSEPVCANNSLGIFEEEDLYYQGDLDSLYEVFTNIPNGTAPIDLSIDGGLAPPPSIRGKGWREVAGEANLDLQSAQPIIYPQNTTIFQADDRYYAHAVDYDIHGLLLFNDFLDAIDGSYCTSCAFGECGNDPKHDPKYPDPHPHGYKGKTQCGVFKPTNVISISWGGGEVGTPYYYQRRQCNEFLKLALQGVSTFVASGDSGSACDHVYPEDRVMYFPERLVGCPWVTAVGGTQIPKDKTVHDSEEAASEQWAGISSGGGFSIVFDRPKYQEQAIPRYFEASNNASDLPYFTDGKYRGNQGIYNRNGRGIPDISALSSNLAGWDRNQYGGSSGTSASAPIVAALFNRIVEERIRAGKRGPIGLVNPTLYKNPDIMNDITKGNNGECINHNRIFVGSDLGYNCTEGWDPVTGLGTPKYPELLKVFMDLP